MLLASIFDPNPVIFLEHRWLHNLKIDKLVKKKNKSLKTFNSKKLISGKDLTIVSSSFGTVECLDVVKELKKESIFCELIDLRVIKPLNLDLIYNSVKKTGKILVIDMDCDTCGIGSEIISKVSQNVFPYLKEAPQKISMPDVPVPTSFALTKDFYFSKIQIIKKIKNILKINRKISTELFLKKK